MKNPTPPTAKIRAPKGGCVVDGVFYKGGQFLPEREPQKGRWNTPKQARRKKVRKSQVAPFVWVANPDNRVSIYTRIAGVLATFEDGVARLSASEKTLSYFGYTQDQAQRLIARYNAGEIWE